MWPFGIVNGDHTELRVCVCPKSTTMTCENDGSSPFLSKGGYRQVCLHQALHVHFQVIFTKGLWGMCLFYFSLCPPAVCYSHDSQKDPVQILVRLCRSSAQQLPVSSKVQAEVLAVTYKALSLSPPLYLSDSILPPFFLLHKLPWVLCRFFETLTLGSSYLCPFGVEWSLPRQPCGLQPTSCRSLLESRLLTKDFLALLSTMLPPSPTSHIVFPALDFWFVLVSILLTCFISCLPQEIVSLAKVGIFLWFLSPRLSTTLYPATRPGPGPHEAYSKYIYWMMNDFILSVITYIFCIC